MERVNDNLKRIQTLYQKTMPAVNSVLIPLIVGIVSMILLDASFGTLENSGFQQMYRDNTFRYVALWVTAYGVNNGDAKMSTIAVLLYVMMYSSPSLAKRMFRSDVFKKLR